MAQVPELSNNTLNSLAKRVEENFISEAEKDVRDKVKHGVLLMESSLAINGKNSYHNEVVESYSNAAWNEYRKKHFWHSEIMNRTLMMLMAMTLSSGIIPVWLVLANDETSLSGAVGTFFKVLALTIILAGLAMLTAFVINISSTRKKRLSVRTDAKIEASEFNDEDLMNCYHSDFFNCYSFKTYITNIAQKMDIDPQSAQENLGRVHGGGSTYYGFGSGGAVGLGIGLSAISKMRAASANSYVNSRIQDVELYVFYANVAHYFNQNVREILSENVTQ